MALELEREIPPVAAHARGGGALRDALRRCAAETGLEHALLAMMPLRRGGEDGAGGGVRAAPRSGPTLSVVASHSRGPADRPLALERWQRAVLREAILAAEAQLAVRQRRRPGPASAEALVVAPVFLRDGRVWGAAAALGVASSRRVPLRPVTRLAERAAQFVSPLLLPPHPDAHPDARPDAPALPHAAEDILAHELRAPLGAAGYALDLLASSPPAPDHAGRHAEQDARLLETARLGVGEALAMLRARGWLDALARGMAEPSIQPVPAREAVAQALALLPAAGPRALLRIPDDLPHVAADRAWLLHALTNVLENAVKYGRREGPIEIEAYREERREARDRVVFVVTSYGAGVPLDRLAAMFRPYVRGAAPDGVAGRGLGLHIAERCVALMGGETWMESDGVSRTTVALALPIARPAGV